MLSSLHTDNYLPVSLPNNQLGSVETVLDPKVYQHAEQRYHVKKKSVHRRPISLTKCLKCKFLQVSKLKTTEVHYNRGLDAIIQSNRISPMT